MTSRFPAKRPLLYLITDGSLTDDNFQELKGRTIGNVRNAVERGVDLVQVREKSLSARLLVELAVAIREACRPEALLFVNDRFDVALAAESDGVHLTESSLPISVVRRTAGQKLLIGCSRHDVKGVRSARDDGADFSVLGPVFHTPGKGEPIGLEGFAAACDAVPGFPVFGLGGIDARNARNVVDAGAAGIAAIRSLNDTHALADFKWK